MRSPAISRKSAIRGNRWRFTILGAYKRRWAPYVQAHEPGQGQLPLDRVWPQGLWFLSGSADRIGNIVCFRDGRQWSPETNRTISEKLRPPLPEHEDGLVRPKAWRVAR